jgi:anthranilate synthase/aminodeoxychorismate synthase-like glutamine amidotransferase
MPVNERKEKVVILLIDNYDSFTYNLYQYLCELGTDVKTFRNDKISLEETEDLKPDGIVISPGPCTPREAGISNDVIRHFGEKLPILGVCLGHQCMGQVYGGTVDVAGEIMHGKTSLIHHDGKGVFQGLPNPFEAIRYHSLVIYTETLPDELEVTARTDKGLIMGVRHKRLPVEGVQFHPESIMTKVGHDLLRNYLKRVEEWKKSKKERVA